MLDITKPALFVAGGFGFPRPSNWMILKQGKRYYLYHQKNGYQWEIEKPNGRFRPEKQIAIALRNAVKNDPNFPRW